MSANCCNEHGIICSLANANGYCRVSACYNKMVDYVPKPNKNLVEVVRCKECKHYKDTFCGCHTAPYCNRESREYRNPDDYCSYGERKEP